MVQGSDNEDEDDDQEAAVAKHRNASISEMLRGKSDVEMHGQYTSVSKALFRTEFDPALNAFEGTNIFKILLRDRSLSRQERKGLDDALQLYFTSVNQIRYGDSIQNKPPGINNNKSQEKSTLGIKTRAFGSSYKGDGNSRVVVDPPSMSLKSMTSSVPTQKRRRPNSDDLPQRTKRIYRQSVDDSD
ncbi:hypothetical protein FRC02_001990 [Tulasnella sp. 418]|nr:hypothetical protein FRC02_001990 [Tulasnella sp. 418]